MSEQPPEQLTLFDLYDPEHEVDDESLDWGDEDEEFYGSVSYLEDCE